MKNILLSLLFTLNAAAWDGVILAWQPNSEPDVTNYLASTGTSSGNYTLNSFSGGKTNIVFLFPWAYTEYQNNPSSLGQWATNGTVVVNFNSTDRVWFFAAKAAGVAGLSVYSNELGWTNEIAPPKGLRIQNRIGMRLFELNLGLPPQRGVIEQSVNGEVWNEWLQFTFVDTNIGTITLHPADITVQSEFYRVSAR